MNDLAKYESRVPSNPAELRVELERARQSVDGDRNGMNDLSELMAALVRRFKKDAEYRTCIQIERTKLEWDYCKTFPKYSRSESGKLGADKQSLSTDKCLKLESAQQRSMSRTRALFSQFSEYEINRVLRTAEQRLKDPKSLMRTIVNDRAKQDRLQSVQSVEEKPNYAILQSSCKGLINVVEPKSVDVVFTDPPYTRDEINKGVFDDLGQFCKYALKDTGVLVCYTGFFIQSVIDLCNHLTYYAPICIHGLTRGKVPQGYAYQIQHKQVHILVPNRVSDYSFYRLNSGLSLINSTIKVSDGFAGRSIHHWEQDIETAKSVLEQFVLHEHTLIDPFAGSGAFLKAAQLLGVQNISGYDVDDVHCTEWVN